MDQQDVFERHRLRRKLRWWRLLTILAVIIGIVSLTISNDNSLITGDHIARVEIIGVIQDDDELIARLDAIGDDSNAKALIVTISSPGGTTYGGERIYKAIKGVSDKKPVVADVRTMAASAGYMIAAASHHIVAGEASIVGSIGVIFQYPQVSKLLDKIGVSMEEIKSAPLKAEPSPFHPASEEAVAMINNMVVDSYDWFIDIVAENRKLSRQDTLKLSDGSIFTGRQAAKNGLVDSLGGMAEIRTYLSEKNIKKELKIVDWPAPDISSPNFLSLALPNIVQRYLGVEQYSLGELLGEKKLFLDGLLSFWQISD
ncbi:signal peptide peptidase SppA [Lentilitoribacter sp. Alg239-R112]|uniref:signal peptide peptidase SppA n=1 Tax=Lentilitoribacter sp. Alg239-R112 TaxID=2305987 RepID=UPI0013A6E557|nr:signal peptide peptidase SppA [Lentilitoribacter sp. Alg239-R112]